MVGDILQPTHLLFILVVALLVLGPKRLPEVGRTLGNGLRDFRAAINGESDHSDAVAGPVEEAHPTYEPPVVEQHSSAAETVSSSESHELAGNAPSTPDEHLFAGQASPAPAEGHEFAGQASPGPAEGHEFAGQKSSAPAEGHEFAHEADQPADTRAQPLS